MNTNNLENKIQKYQQSRQSDLRLKFYFILGFLVLILCFFPPGFIDTTLELKVSFEGERRLTEQLSKYYLFITILISTHTYTAQNKKNGIKLAICFLLLGLVMYLSESNMMHDDARPVFGLLILAYIFYLLAVSREWLVSFLLLLGCVLIAMGQITDIVLDNIAYDRAEFIKAFVPLSIRDYISTLNEEPFEVAGAASVCLSMIIYSFDSLQKLFRNSRYTVLGFLIAAGMIAIGNSFLHWGHSPSDKLTLFHLQSQLWDILV